MLRKMRIRCPGACCCLLTSTTWLGYPGGRIFAKCRYHNHAGYPFVGVGQLLSLHCTSLDIRCFYLNQNQQRTQPHSRDLSQALHEQPKGFAAQHSGGVLAAQRNVSHGETSWHVWDARRE